MKVIFLDIDGVLNSIEYFENNRDTDAAVIDSSKLPLIRELVDRTGARIVLSSSWRSSFFLDKSIRGGNRIKSLDEIGNMLLQMFDEYGLTLYSITPHHNDFGRGGEIWSWLWRHPYVRRFVILDDTFFPDFKWMKRHLVMTDGFLGNGVNKTDIARAISILNGRKC